MVWLVFKMGHTRCLCVLFSPKGRVDTRERP